jgi:glucose-6-phosphate 1-dehydrogenase
MNKNVQPPVIVIFGITGDLSRRKLLPALYHLFHEKTLPSTTRIIGTSRRELALEDLLHMIEESVEGKDENCKPEILNELSKAIDTIQIDPENKDDYLKRAPILYVNSASRL